MRCERRVIGGDQKERDLGIHVNNGFSEIHLRIFRHVFGVFHFQGVISQQSFRHGGFLDFHVAVVAIFGLYCRRSLVGGPRETPEPVFLVAATPSEKIQPGFGGTVLSR